MIFNPLNSYEMLRKNTIRELRHGPFREIEPGNESTIKFLSGLLSWLVGQSLSRRLMHSPLEIEIPGLLAVVLFFEMKHLAEDKAKHQRKAGMQGFLANDFLTNSDVHKHLQEFEIHSKFFRHSMWREGSFFPAFFASCAKSQARIIDYLSDSRFLLRLLRFIVKGEIEKGALFPFVRGIAEDVIIRKTISHEDAPSKMAKAVLTTQYFREFDEVLERVLASWRVRNE
jgi:hypothetical protein